MMSILEHMRNRNLPPRDDRLAGVLRRVEDELTGVPQDEYAPRAPTEEARAATVEEKIARLEDLTRALSELTAEKAALAKEIDMDFLRLNERRNRMVEGQAGAKIE